ncbi:flagellar hook-length control protein FliK [Thauera linaloolentis]|nr:flagellar hook-length control protein FliK [Thauera linaloolentis]MCM8565435.1 flagellar hook-length control protein FliK [Thauera linaloolentis]
MPASVSSSSLAQGLQGTAGRKLSDQAMTTGLAGLIGPGKQQASFSRTLQNQLHASHAQPAQTQTTRASDASPRTASPVRQREADRSAQRSTAQEPERAQPQTPDADAGRGTAETAAATDGTASGNDGQRGNPDSPHDSGTAPAEEGTDAAGTADAAAIAGLPAAIAALRSETASAAGEADGDLAAGDSTGKSLQNAGLLPKDDTGLANAGADADTAAQSVQGRLPIMAAIADKAAGTAAALQAGDGDMAIQQPAQASGGHHGANLLGVLRHAPAPSTPQLPVQTPASQHAWAEDVGNQVRWMLGRAESKAELVLTPPNLGKLEVSISLSGDQTTAQFVASSQAARDALEQALPRLREILQQSGISLGQADVSTSEDRSAGSDGGGQGRHAGGSGETFADTAGGKPAVWQQQHDGLVDTFV